MYQTSKVRKSLSLFLAFTLMISLLMPSSVFAASVKLNKTKLTLNVKQTYPLKLKSNKKKVKWSSSKKSVATVNSKGKVTAKKKGSATITAKVGKKKYTCKVTVKQPVTSVTLNKKSITIKGNGKTYTLKATVNPSNANDKSLTWKSSDKSVATVNTKGKVTAVKSGTTKITATAKDGSKKSYTCKVTVSGIDSSEAVVTSTPTEPVTPEDPSVTTSPVVPETTAKPTDAAKITEAPTSTPDVKATATPTPTTKPKATATPTPVVTPDADGFVNGVKVATGVASTGIAIDGDQIISKKHIGDTIQLTTTITPSNATDKSVTWCSTNENVATVDQNGKVTCIGKGSCYIKAYANNWATSDTYKNAPKEYQIENCRPGTSIVVRVTMNAIPVITPSVATPTPIPTATPTPTPTATPTPAPVLSKINFLSFKGADCWDAFQEKMIPVGGTKTLNLDIYYEGYGENTDIIYSSSDESIATVDSNGVVTGLKQGYVTITAKAKYPSSRSFLNDYASDSTTYKIGEYTYDEVLNDVTLLDISQGKKALDYLNQLRQNPDLRPSCKDVSVGPVLEWDDGYYQCAAVRSVENIISLALGLAKDPAEHGLSQNSTGLSYGGQDTGTSWKNVANWFDDYPHAWNQCDSYNKYEAVAIAVYYNRSGAGCVSIISEFGSYSTSYNLNRLGKDLYMSASYKSTGVSEEHFTKISKRFGLNYIG